MSDRPARAEALFFEGNRLLGADDAAAAERCYRDALALAPDFAEALANLALLRDRAGALDEAEAAYRRVIALDPDGVQNRLNFGSMLARARRFAEAESVDLDVLRRAPESSPAWSNLGVLMASRKHEDEAENCYRTALALDPTYAKARFNLAYILLRQGRFEEGWACLEARDGYQDFARHFHCPRWQGEALDGKSLIIGLEAGHGDMIQFCRYARLLKARGAARVDLICHPALKPLFVTLPGVDTVFSPDDAVADANWDFWTPPLSLPYYFGTRLETIPADIPYLAADLGRVATWRALMPDATTVRHVGLAWKGNPRFENDADRSLPSLDVLTPLGAVRGVRFVSLQKGVGEDEARHPPTGLTILPLGESIADFADTAAIIAQLDLVISVDTAVAHLAGALGKPCWVLLPDYQTDWRWLTGREDSPWYPGMRLFRQPAGGGWGVVIGQVVEALRAL